MTVVYVVVVRGAAVTVTWTVEMAGSVVADVVAVEELAAELEEREPVLVMKMVDSDVGGTGGTLPVIGTGRSGEEHNSPPSSRCTRASSKSISRDGMPPSQLVVMINLTEPVKGFLKSKPSVSQSKTASGLTKNVAVSWKVPPMAPWRAAVAVQVLGGDDCAAGEFVTLGRTLIEP